MRKIFSFVISVLMIVSSFGVYVNAAEIKTEERYSVGDVDCDGTVNAEDSLCMKRQLVGDAEMEINAMAADMDADGRITAKDSYYIKGIFVEKFNASEFDSGTKLYKLLIGGYDIKEFCIVLPEDATRDDNAHFAAEKMQKYVEIATGYKLEICYGYENKTAVHAIVYNMVELECELGRELGYEGYKYDVTDGDLNIYGTRRGNMYCTFDLLERMGFVFYSDDYTFLKEARLVRIEEGETETFVPKVHFRMVAGSNFDGDGVENHFLAQKLNGSQLYHSEDDMRIGTLTGPRFINAHSFGYYWRMATGNYTDDDHLYECWQSGIQKEESDYGKDAPWQPCATSGGDYNTLMLGLDRTITMIEKRGHKFTADISSMSFSIADNQKGYCSCRNCTKKTKTEGYSGLYIDLTNRAARDIKTLYPEYPTLKLVSIIYDHSIPATVRPESNVIVFFCGQGCNNHPINSGECTGNEPLIHKLHNDAVVESLKAWSGFCHESGAEIWFWYYPVSFLFYMSPCPNVLKLYDDFNFIINECKVDGFYFECGGRNYAFEAVKAHMASEYMYDPDMTKEEYTELLKEFLYLYFGEGYEYIYRYLEKEDLAGTKDACYLNNFSYPQDMYNTEYVAENYIDMRNLILDALILADSEDEIEHLEKLLVCCDFTGLSAVHKDWYAAGMPEYVEYYDEMCRLIQKYDMRPSTFLNEDGTPEQLDFTNYEQSPWDQVA